MGNGPSTGQGRDTTYGTRDARRYSAETSYWPELDGAKLAESSGTGRNPHIGAQNVRPKSSASNSMGEYLDSTRDSPRCDANARYVPEVRNPHIGASNVGLSSSSVADTRSGTDTGTESSMEPGVYDSREELPKSSTVGAARSDEEDNGFRGEDNTLSRRKTTLAEMHGSKSSLLDAGTRELAGQVRGPLLSHSIRELAGSPASPLPSANIQELAE